LIEVRKDAQKKSSKKLEINQDLSLMDTEKPWNGNNKLTAATSPTQNMQTVPGSQSYASPRLFQRNQSRPLTSTPSKQGKTNDLSNMSMTNPKTTATSKVGNRDTQICPWVINI